MRLGQVATVEDGFAEPSSYSLRSGQPNVGLSIIRSREASTVSVAERVRKEVEEINKTLPEGTKLEITRDGGDEASQNLNNVIHALIFGAGLTIFVVYAFLNSWRSTLITGLSLPTSAIAAFIAVWLCGFTLNFMTLLGLSLAIGVLIDDAIVVRENIVRHMERGEDRMTAARNGTAEIGLAVTATTFSIVAVFVPVAFMGGGAGEWFRPFAVTVVSSVLVSLFISFTLDPMLSAYWGDPPGYAHARAPRTRQGVRALQHVVRPPGQSLRQGHRVGAASPHVDGVWRRVPAGRCAGLPGQCSAAANSCPSPTTARWPSKCARRRSTSLEYARNKVEKAAELARQIPGSEVHRQPRQFHRRPCLGGRRRQDGSQRAGSSDLAADLREKLKPLVGAEYVVLDDLNNGARKPVQIQFYGTDSRKLMEITNEFMDKMRKIPGAVDVGLSEQDPKDELRIELDRGLANQLGISVNDAAQTLRVAFAGVEVGDWVDPTGESRDVAVRLSPEDRARCLQHRAPADRRDRHQHDGAARADRDHHHRQGSGAHPALQRQAHRDGVRQRAGRGCRHGELRRRRRSRMPWSSPPGFGVGLGGASRDQNELFAEMGIALLMGIFVMYLVLVMQFGSFTAPLPIMLSLPLSLIGVVLALNLTGGSLNLMSLIGVIMLMGLVAKNAILLLDCAREEEKQGIDREEALMHAGRVRLRPILMTTFALMAGMMPVAIGVGEGGEFYSARWRWPSSAAPSCRRC